MSLTGGTIGDVLLEAPHRIGDNGRIAGKAKSRQQKSVLYYAREARGMSRSELVKRSGVPSRADLARKWPDQVYGLIT